MPRPIKGRRLTAARDAAEGALGAPSTPYRPDVMDAVPVAVVTVGGKT